MLLSIYLYLLLPLEFQQYVCLSFLILRELLLFKAVGIHKVMNNIRDRCY